MESTRMDHTGFDTLSRSLATFGSRRALLRLVTALPLTGLLATLLTEEGAAGGRHKRRKTRNKRRSGEDKDNRTGKRKGRGTGTGRQGQEAYAAVHAAQLSPGSLHRSRWVWRDADLRLQRQSHLSGWTCVACDVCATGCDFDAVQAAVDAAASGDTITICAGTYLNAKGRPVIAEEGSRTWI